MTLASKSASYIQQITIEAALAPIASETMVCGKYINIELRTLRKLRKQRV